MQVRKHGFENLTAENAESRVSFSAFSADFPETCLCGQGQIEAKTKTATNFTKHGKVCVTLLPIPAPRFAQQPPDSRPDGKRI
jgi:hypothetical protein